MLWKILGALTLIIVALALFVATRPDTFSVTREKEIAAPADKVFEQVNDLRNWEKWSPWLGLDPEAKLVYTDSTAGKGASFSWDGNDKIGAGSNTITESVPNERIKIDLKFLKPFESTSDVEFTFKPQGNNTRVTWTMSGKQNFIGKAMSCVMDCDKLIGGDFEKGLNSLARASGAPSPPTTP